MYIFFLIFYLQFSGPLWKPLYVMRASCLNIIIIIIIIIIITIIVVVIIIYSVQPINASKNSHIGRIA